MFSDIVSCHELWVWMTAQYRDLKFWLRGRVQLEAAHAAAQPVHDMKALAHRCKKLLDVELENVLYGL
jgi:hypothetical protein